MNKKINHPVFQINDSTWGHLIKTVNPDIYTIEYGHIAGFSSKEEAEKSYREYVNSYQTQILRLKESRNMPFTFSEYLDYWYRKIYMPFASGSSTLYKYRWIIYYIILPHLHKDILLECVTTDYLNKVLQACQAYCKNGGFYAYKVLHTILRSAFENGYIPDDKFPQMQQYPEPNGMPVFYSDEQIRKLLSVSSKSSIYLEILLTLFCGLSKGEILGLKYSDFNQKEGTLTIQRIYVVDYKSEKKHKLKTVAGTRQNRTLKLPSFIFKELKKRKRENRRLQAHSPSADSFRQYISIGPTGKIKSDSTLRSALKRVTLDAGLPVVNMRDLRYMSGRILAEQGLPIEMISNVLGHAKLSTTLNFCSKFPAKGENVRNVINDVLDPIFGIGGNFERENQYETEIL